MRLNLNQTKSVWHKLSKSGKLSWDMLFSLKVPESHSLFRSIILDKNLHCISQSTLQMRKILSVFLLFVLACLVTSETNGTESYFLSPHGIGQSPQVDNALLKIAGQVKPKRTTYSNSDVTYIMDNITITAVYNDARQNISIPKTDTVQVTGGRIEFTYRFNYTRIQNRNNITGYGYGSVFTDVLTYFKEFAICGSFVCWRLLKTGGMSKITITNKMAIKRIEPLVSQADVEIMQNMLDTATTSIDPSNIKVQMLEVFNQIFPLAMDDSLNHEIYGEKINYTYHSSSHGELAMNIVHQVQTFGVSPQSGYKMIFITKIENFNESICNITVPLQPFSFEIYGGSQNFHLNCLYEEVVSYMQSNGWLDTVLNDNWESSSFQFYAGDLFDIISNLHINFSPRAILDGACAAQKEGLRIYSSRQFESNTYTLDVNYICTLKGTSKEGSTTPILKFTANTKLYIKAEATTKTLTFKIIFAEVLNLNFTPVGNYFPSNIVLAMFKVNSVLKNVINTFTFGTGFPTIVRDLPKTRVDRDYVLYYDNSHINQTLLI